MLTELICMYIIAQGQGRAYSHLCLRRRCRETKGRRNHMVVREGWRGRFLEDFEVGDVYEHPLGRTITSTDNAWFTLITQNTNPIHFDAHYASQTEFGRPLVNSGFTLALVMGLSVSDLSQNGVNLGW